MGDPVGALAAILPLGAVGVEMEEDEDEDFTGSLLAEERVAIEGASPGRRREFAAGRECARRALRMLGVDRVALPVGCDGAPVWPHGTVGSITHKGTYRAAAVAHTSDLTGLGIDAEHDAPLPSGVLTTIASPQELDQVERLLAEHPGTTWDRLLFSAKEATLKAAHTLGSRPTGARSFDVRLDESKAAFIASAVGREQMTARGAWHRGGEMVLTAAYLRSA